MSQRANRHQRRPSQSLFVSPDYLLAPLSDDAAAADKVADAAAAAAAAVSGQAMPPQPITPPLPPTPKAAETKEVPATDNQKTADAAN
ncbi:unnamed protein product [Prunus armeniaca]|uniref:Uncharacterized protein n=1 Tax=Prunus armeniaca TaxID=36596 RepID=A0A6J5VEX9_PRUAR|nr:unnamed protein product [Prunus armeniaca]CAB4314874.1 unnamed protein product [Prunus armeniaca]